MKHFFLAVSFFLCLVCYAQTGIEKHYKIYNTHTKQLTTPEEIAADCKDVHVLFFGEEHNDSAGHFLETAIFKALYKLYGSNLALGMEMFDRCCSRCKALQR